MTPDQITAAVALLTVLGTVLTGFATRRSAVVQGYDALVDQLQEEVAGLRTQVAGLHSQVGALESGMRDMSDKLRTAQSESEFRYGEIKGYRDLVNVHEEKIQNDRRRIAALERALREVGIDPATIDHQQGGD